MFALFEIFWCGKYLKNLVSVFILKIPLRNQFHCQKFDKNLSIQFFFIFDKKLTNIWMKTFWEIFLYTGELATLKLFRSESNHKGT